MSWRDLSNEAPSPERRSGRAAEQSPPPKTFTLERWGDIVFDGREEWLVKRYLPRQGLAAIFGKPGSFKSFVASDLALSVAVGWQWADRRVTQAPVVYIAAEGAAGLRKRKAGFMIAYPDLPVDVPFALVSTAPNLGSEKSDLAALVSAIEASDIGPGLVVIDTLAQTLGAGVENGSGMTAFISNARALSDHFKCLVLIVHHTGLGDDKRMRGHSSLHGALDAQILCEREEGQLSAILTLRKLKDDASDARLMARLSRVVIAYDEKGDEISTLVVEALENAEPRAEVPRARSVPRSQSLLIETIKEAIDDAGENFRPFGTDGPLVRAVDDRKVRDRYYERIAETPKDDDTPKELADRQRQSFNTSIKRNLDAKLICAASKNGRRLVWIP